MDEEQEEEEEETGHVHVMSREGEERVGQRGKLTVSSNGHDDAAVFLPKDEGEEGGGCTTSE